MSGEGINDSGDIVGHAYDCGGSGDTAAFLWTSETGLDFIEFPVGTYSSTAVDLNDAGQVVGWYNPPTEFGALAFLLDEEGLTTIYPPPGGSFSEAFAINNSGQVVGETANPETNSAEAFLWQSEKMTILGPLSIPWSSARDINEAGVIVGHMGDTSPFNPTARGFIWDNGKITVLDPIPGGVTSVASAINNFGQVVGRGLVPSEVSLTGFVSHPFLRSDDQLIDLGTLPGTDFCGALDINDFGQIIGYCGLINQGYYIPFLWQDGAMTEVNDLLPPSTDLTITFVSSINHQGQIVGQGAGDSDTVAVLLTPVVFDADLNGNCNVNVADLALLLGAWGRCPDCPEDLTGDDVVNAFDLALLLGSWG